MSTPLEQYITETLCRFAAKVTDFASGFSSSEPMTAQLRMTVHVQAVLRLPMSDPDAERYGLEIADAAGMMPGTAYPILARLLSLGWVEDRWEKIDPHTARRPKRRFYKLTETGLTAAPETLARARQPRLIR
jgi:PadR family transcriptional regulator, regulatory protein PadR